MSSTKSCPPGHQGIADDKMSRALAVGLTWLRSLSIMVTHLRNVLSLVGYAPGLEPYATHTTCSTAP